MKKRTVQSRHLFAIDVQMGMPLIRNVRLSNFLRDKLKIFYLNLQVPARHRVLRQAKGGNGRGLRSCRDFNSPMSMVILHSMFTMGFSVVAFSTVALSAVAFSAVALSTVARWLNSTGYQY